MKARERRILEAILDSPTAPYHEHVVQARLEAIAAGMDCAVRRDRWGNTYVRYRHGRARPVAFSGHMDHPGFEVLSAGRRAQARLLGGVLPETMRRAPVVFHRPVSQPVPRKLPAGVRGSIQRVTSRDVPGARRPEITVELQLESAVEVGDYGHFDFAGVGIHGTRLHSKAHDNLLSCALILSTMDRLRRRGIAADVLGVFTRAEEVGFVGAGGVLRSTILRPSRPLVVLECSKAVGAVQLGGGPVLRVGDRMTCFDPFMDLWLTQEAQVLQQATPSFRVQRALMTGGACEASLFQLHDRRVGALAMPLENYHNMTADGGIGPEIVDLRDFDNALLLLEHLAQNPPTARHRTAPRRALDRIFRQGARRLARTRQVR